MKLGWPMMVFGSAFVLALAALYLHRARAWYWHVLSVLLALGLGMAPRAWMPFPAHWDENAVYLTVGFFFVFLLFWGLAAPFFRRARGRRAG